MLDLDSIAEATKESVLRGVRHFQAFLLHEDGVEHSARLLSLMDPPHGAVVVDAGCGIGELAKDMHALRPDLRLILLNLSKEQLALCPPEMVQHLADFMRMPLSDKSADVVLFSYSASQAPDLGAMLREARRVLRDDGIVFIHDLTSMGDANPKVWESVGAKLIESGKLIEHAGLNGFKLDSAHHLIPAVDQIRALVDDDASHAALVHGVESAAWRFQCVPIDPIASAFARHKGRIGFQFSGGRDSTAALYSLRPYWDQMTVYHVDSGDRFPETRDIVERVGKEVPIVVIQGNVDAVRQAHGLATDLLPAENTTIGRWLSGREPKLMGRFDCCAMTIMQPMHQRMQKDGITLLVRGQRDSDYAAPPMRSGDSRDGFEVLYPIQSWSGDQVEDYLRTNNLPVADFYREGMTRASDCMKCTAWWDDGRPQYLRRFHPAEHAEFMNRINIVRAEINHQADMLAKELEA